MIGKNQFPHLGFRVSYDGSEFSGFQRQKHHRSIQAQIERSWAPLFGSGLKIQFSSRTDAGVHSWDQWVVISEGRSLYLSLPEKTKRALLISLNALLPDSIRVWDCFFLREDFNPKSSPLWKEYSYTVLNGPAEDPLMKARSLWIRRPLDIRLMRAEMRKIVGAHDFSAFATRAARYEDNTTRRILATKLEVKSHPGLEGLQVLDFVFRGKGFLHHMVRTLVGTLIEVGLGQPHDFSKILQQRLRAKAGFNAPPHPLVLRRTYVAKSFLRRIDALVEPHRGASKINPPL